jgi:hypothetical protein
MPHCFDQPFLIVPSTPSPHCIINGIYQLLIASSPINRHS